MTASLRKYRNISLFLTAAALVAAALIWLRYSSKAPLWVKLEQIPGITKETLNEKGRLYRISEPIAYLPKSDLAIFEVEIIGPGFDEPSITFTGDGARFNEFVSEVRFVQANQGALLRNLGKGIIDPIKALWDAIVTLVTTNPEQTLEGIKGFTVHAWDYVSQAVQGKKDVPEDFQQMIGAVYIGYLTEIASEAGINFVNPVTEEAKQAVEAVGQQRLVGSTATEIAMFVAPFLNIGKASKAVGTAGKVVLLEESMAAPAALLRCSVPGSAGADQF